MNIYVCNILHRYGWLAAQRSLRSAWRCIKASTVSFGPAAGRLSAAGGPAWSFPASRCIRCMASTSAFNFRSSSSQTSAYRRQRPDDCVAPVGEAARAECLHACAESNVTHVHILERYVVAVAKSILNIRNMCSTGVEKERSEQRIDVDAVLRAHYRRWGAEAGEGELLQERYNI